MNLKFWTWFSEPEQPVVAVEPAPPAPPHFHIERHKPKPVSEKERDRANIPRPKFDEVKEV